MGVWKGRMATGRIPLLMTHLAVTLSCLKIWTEVNGHCVYLRALILEQTCRRRTQHQRKHHRPVLMSTHTPLMTEGRSAIIRLPLTFTCQRSTGSLSKHCCCLQVDSSSYWKFKDKNHLRHWMISKGTVCWENHSDSILMLDFVKNRMCGFDVAEFDTHRIETTAKSWVMTQRGRMWDVRCKLR